jgi:PelA/Pel-15E family pectate lyase
MPDETAAQARSTIKWAKILEQSSEWYGSGEATRIADNVLLFQRDSGGWPKNIDMAALLSEREKANLAREKATMDSTIDNGATFTQLSFLARVYTRTRNERYGDAFKKGVDYLLKAQYENGGWPQFYPDLSGYYKHITYNDNAMVGVMKLLRDLSNGKGDYAFVDQDRRDRAERAMKKAVEIVLKTQVIVNGKRTVWAAQHDRVSLAPAPARKFEPASLTSAESVGIVRFLMGIKNPDTAVVDAIESAVTWFEKSKINGIRWVEKSDGSKPRGFDRVVVKDAAAGPIWARFYEIETTRPIFVGRDGIIRYDVAEIEEERRNGYAWYVDTPAKLLADEYPKWRQKILDF